MPMKTLIILYYKLDTGGIQTKIIDLINFLTKHRPLLQIILVLRKRSMFDRVGEITNFNAKILYFSDSVWSRVPILFPLYLTGIILRERSCAILSFTFFDSISAVLTKLLVCMKPITVVISQDSYIRDELYFKVNQKINLLKQFLLTLFYPKANAICCVNNDISSILIKKYSLPRSLISVVSNWYSPQHVSRKIFRRKKYDLIYVGRLEKIKNIASILSTLVKFNARHHKLSFCIVGSGPEESKLKRYVITHKLSDRIYFFGYSQNPGIYMAQSKIFILASRSEGLPIAPLEAMANKLPILCSNYPTAQNVIKEGYNGYIYHSRRELVTRVSSLLRHPEERRALGENGFEFVNKKYSISNIQIYLKLLKI